jgi:hypothetical protein
MHGLVALDRHDRPLCRLITWARTRASAQAERLAAEHPELHESLAAVGSGARHPRRSRPLPACSARSVLVTSNARTVAPAMIRAPPSSRSRMPPRTTCSSLAGRSADCSSAAKQRRGSADSEVSRRLVRNPGVTRTDPATAAPMPKRCSTPEALTGWSARPLARFTPAASTRAAASPLATRLPVWCEAPHGLLLARSAWSRSPADARTTVPPRRGRRRYRSGRSRFGRAARAPHARRACPELAWRSGRLRSASSIPEIPAPTPGLLLRHGGPAAGDRHRRALAARPERPRRGRRQRLLLRSNGAVRGVGQSGRLTSAAKASSRLRTCQRVALRCTRLQTQALRSRSWLYFAES